MNVFNRVKNNNQNSLNIDSEKTLESFNSELELVLLFEKHVALNNTNQQFELLKELDCGFGIADAVLFKMTTLNDKKRSLGHITPSWAYTLQQLPYRKNFSIEDLSNLSGASIASSKKALKEFSLAGFCQQKSKNIWVKNWQPSPLSKNIIAIEAKLKNWKRALWQASRYKTFAHESWVLLDQRNIAPSLKNICCFERLNVGLASISVMNDICIHHSPILEKPKSDISYWKANAMLANQFI
ncbi:MAG: hypothetical protein OCD00_17555 [Colwellia sp.]